MSPPYLFFRVGDESVGRRVRLTCYVVMRGFVLVAVVQVAAGVEVSGPFLCRSHV